MAEYALKDGNGTLIGKSVTIGGVRHGPSNYATLASNGDIKEVLLTMVMHPGFWAKAKEKEKIKLHKNQKKIILKDINREILENSFKVFIT